MSSFEGRGTWESFLLLQEYGEDNWNLEVGVGKDAALSFKNQSTIGCCKWFLLVCALTAQPQFDFRMTLLHFDFFSFPS